MRLFGCWSRLAVGGSCAGEGEWRALSRALEVLVLVVEVLAHICALLTVDQEDLASRTSIERDLEAARFLVM